MSQLSVQRVDGEFLVRVDRPLWVKLFYRNCHLYRHRLTGQLVLLTAQEEQDLIVKFRRHNAKLIDSSVP